MRDVEKLESICNKCQLDNEFDEHILLCHHVATQQRRPLLYVLVLKLLEKELRCGGLCNRNQQRIEQHEEENAPYDGHLDVGLALVVLEEHGHVD